MRGTDLLPMKETIMAKNSLPVERLGDVLTQSLKRLELNARLEDYAIWPIWNEVVGAAIARNAQPEKIRNGTLFVKVSSPVWMQQLQFMKEMIADKLNEKLKNAPVKTLFFMVGRIEAPADEPATAAPATAAPRAVDSSFVDSIDDAEIRDAFKKLLDSFARRQTRPE